MSGHGRQDRGDFPRTIAEFHRRFPDDETCLQYLVETRWPDGFRCPGCGSPNARLLATRRVWQCRACRRQTSATAGTVPHRTRQPLTAWFTGAIQGENFHALGALLFADELPSTLVLIPAASP